MYSIAHAEPSLTSDAWVQLSALHEVRTAIAVLEDAGAALTGLLDDSAWDSDAVRALHDLFARVRDGTGTAVGDLTTSEWELEGVVLG